MDEWERILRTGTRVGPEYRDLKWERLWKLLAWVSVLLNEFEQRDFFGSQSTRGFGGHNLPNCDASR
jgi:hypothetical protein